MSAAIATTSCEQPAAPRHERLVALIRAIHPGCVGTYGVRRMHRELLEAAENDSRKRVRRLMREHGIRSVHTPRFHKTTDSNHALGFAPNLGDQDFATTPPDRVWVGDITYVWTAEGWTYLAALLDLYSRRAVGWAMADTLHTALPLRALERALEARGPAPGLIHHSDRGSPNTRRMSTEGSWQNSRSRRA